MKPKVYLANAGWACLVGSLVFCPFQTWEQAIACALDQAAILAGWGLHYA